MGTLQYLNHNHKWPSMMFYVLTSQNRDYLAWLHWKIRSQEYSFDLIRSFQMVIYNDFPFNSSIFVRAMFDSPTVKTSTKAPPTEMHGKCPVKFPQKKGSPLPVPSQNLRGRSMGPAGAHWPPGEVPKLLLTRYASFLHK